MSSLAKNPFAPSRRDASDIRKINALRSEFNALNDDQLRTLSSATDNLCVLFAVTAVIASRALGQNMFDVQLRGALALTRGSIAEMQTGEGKTLAAVPAVAWFARKQKGVHVITANDYLACRDADWMGQVYRRMGLTVGSIKQGLTSSERRAAYAADVTYATANEIGFDFLRDQLAFDATDQVHRPFSTAVIDEADSILIDEARIPLVIAGGNNDDSSLAAIAEELVRQLRPGWHYVVVNSGRNVTLTDQGVRLVENASGCHNLYEERNLALFTTIQDALHAHALLRRDVDYLVDNGAVAMVDEFKGRTALDRRWPAGLHTAIEAKEGLANKPQGMILGSITLQNLAAFYPQVCGMTGTAVSSETELKTVYDLTVEVIPTNRPMIRIDHPDLVFAAIAEKERAVLAEIRRAHLSGQPVLVGTGSVADSENLSRLLADVPHRVLNAKNDESEAHVIASAGQRGAVTISTNMAGRGTDIELGDGVSALGGLYVIGTNKNESRRIDSQLRGRAGRQGDPGCSRFFVSLEDDLMSKYADLNPAYKNDPDSLQRLVEGQNLDLRMFLQRYELPIEGQRHRIQTNRQNLLTRSVASKSERERLIALRTIDDLWADYLARIAEFRSGLLWLSLATWDPLHAYLLQMDQWFRELEIEIPLEIQRRAEQAEAGTGGEPRERGAVWTYVTTDQPFGSFTERIVNGFRRKLRNKDLWG